MKRRDRDELDVALRSEGMSRRDVLRLAALGGAAAATAPVLAACGGSSKKASTNSAGATAANSRGVGNDVAAKVRQYFGPIDEAHSGKGMPINVGAVLPLSGPGAFYGGVQSRGTNLGAKHVKAAGGPDFRMVFKDHKSGDPQAGITASRELGTSGIGLMLSSYNADLFAMLPNIAQYQMLTLDGGGGTSDAGKGKPFFWGTRAITPDDTFPGAVRYLKETSPNARKVALLGWDLGPASTPVIDNLKAALVPAGMSLVHTELTQVGATDYSTPLSRLGSANPDAVFVFLYGLDPGYFMKQYATSGIDKPVFGSEFTADAAKTAGSAYNKYTFAYDFFNAKHPTNDWGALFVDEYRREYSADPDFYAANYYENVFHLWDLVQRTLKRGGNPSKGPDMQAAMLDSLSFKSLYGGSGSTPGITALDPKTHSVAKRPMGVFTYNNGTITPKAFFDIGGADYRAA